MMVLIFSFAVSFVVCMILIPLVRRAALRCGLVDRPDGRRKVHVQVIALGGGVAIFAATCLAMLAALITPLREQLFDSRFTLLGLLLAAIVICVVGLIDDYRAMRGIHKLAWQLVAVGSVIGSGVVVQSVHLFGRNIDLGLLSAPFTAFVLLGAINSLNLLDGMDGLLACIGSIICIAMAAMGMLLGHPVEACLAAALAGALLGFLRYNFPPASIFMGDCGSMLVGLVIGVLAIKSSLKGPATVALAAPMTVMAIPIFDTLAAIVRRKLTGRSLYATDRGHLHHCLLQRGFSTRYVLLCVSFFCTLTLVGALASVWFHNEYFAIFSALTVVCIMIATRLFGYAEFNLVRKRIGASVTSLMRRPADGPSRAEVRLQGTADWAQLWQELTLRAEDLSLSSIRMDVNAPSIHEGYIATWRCGEIDRAHDHLWRTELPLVVNGHAIGSLSIVGRHAEESVGKTIDSLATFVHDLEFHLCQALGVACDRFSTGRCDDVLSESEEMSMVAGGDRYAVLMGSVNGDGEVDRRASGNGGSRLSSSANGARKPR